MTRGRSLPLEDGKTRPPTRAHPQRTRLKNVVSMKTVDFADEADRAVIATGLRAFNEQMAGSPDVRPLNVILSDASGNTIGGLWGRTSWRWVYVELLFVPPELRGARLGAALLAAAEVEARARDCLGIWLETFAFQAPGFYQRQGYVPFGAIDGPPVARTISS